MTLRLAALGQSVVSWMRTQRLVGAAAVSLLIAGVGMIGMGVKRQLGERKGADANDAAVEGFSETIIPGANYARPPAIGIPAPSAEIAILSVPNDLPRTGVIQSAVFQSSGLSSPRGAWLEGTIEEDTDFAESVSHDLVGPRLR